MGKRVQYTIVTPLPNTVPRQLAIELLHAHQEVIELNPLVTGVKAIEAPRDAPSDEYFSQWYEIAEVITWGFGMKKKISFRGVFHDLPYGMQSHTYAPMGVDLRIKYRIGGNQPGEPREPRELGVDTPQDGLYLRQDVEIVCNMALASFVKKETKDSIGKMVDRMVKKAELLDEGKLHAMFEDGKLKTSKPSGFSDNDGGVSPVVPSGPSGSRSPSIQQQSLPTPRLDKKGFGNYHDVARSASHRTSQYSPGYQPRGYGSPAYGQQGVELNGQPHVNELPGSYHQPQPSPGLYPEGLKPQGQVFRSELPGDMTFNTGAAAPQPSPASHPPAQYTVHQGPPGPGATAEQQRAQSYQSQQGNSSERQRLATNDGEYSYPRSPSSPTNNFSLPRSQSNVAPDHQRFSQMSVRDTPSQQEHARQNPSDYGNASCPVCNLFEGDAAAVSHHVSKAHFS